MPVEGKSAITEVKNVEVKNEGKPEVKQVLKSEVGN